MKLTSLTPVTVPVEILALKKTKLPEKLLLGIYASDPTATRVLRALSMGRAGRRKLEQRLIQKGLLTVAGARHMVHVPGLVYTHDPEGGHFVPDSSATKNEKKVARRVAKTTHTDITPLLVPAELLECRYLLASEKVLLGYHVANPSSHNERVVETLGISLAGLKNLKRGLLEKQVLIPSDDGYTIRLPGHVLVRDSQGGHFVSESEAAKIGNIVAIPAPKLTPAQDIYNYWVSSLEKMRRNPSTTASYCLSFTANRIKQIDAESPIGPEREAALVVMKEAENVFFAKDIIKQFEAKALAWAGNATPEQLVAFRVKVEGRMLAGVPEPKLLAMVAKSIAQ
jgi:hypothetical protein